MVTILPRVARPLSAIGVSLRHARLIGIEAGLLLLGIALERAEKSIPREVGVAAQRRGFSQPGGAPCCDLALQLFQSRRSSRMLRANVSCSAAVRAVASCSAALARALTADRSRQSGILTPDGPGAKRYAFGTQPAVALMFKVAWIDPAHGSLAEIRRLFAVNPACVRLRCQRHRPSPAPDS